MTARPPVTLGVALRAAIDDLARAGLRNAVRDGRVLAAAASGLSGEDLLRCPDAELSPEQLGRLQAATARRRRGEPVSRIVGRREFRGIDFLITPATLDPRPDSETLVDAVLARVTGDSPRILDIGTGSGCLLLALLHELPSATGTGIDISPGACRVARTNADRLGLGARASVVAGDWTKPIAGVFDVVVSNPPYIPSARIATLAPEVRLHDPRVSLDGGHDGLDAYRRIAASIGSLVAPGGLVALEIDRTRAPDVCALFAAAGLAPLETCRDLSGSPRVCLFRAHPP